MAGYRANNIYDFGIRNEKIKNRKQTNSEI